MGRGSNNDGVLGMSNFRGGVRVTFLTHLPDTCLSLLELLRKE